ncbi:MAG: hypothetical protein GWN58_37225, partial [Anaerolineae bacterium]|nr:hypothetical protein [Anaerolineae bacterium]
MMAYLDQGQLTKWKAELESEILELEARAKPLLQEMDSLREKLDAVRRLLQDKSASPSSQPLATPQSTKASSRRAFTPVHAYWAPILESLVELGGSAPSDNVIDRVGKKMEGVLTAADREPLSSGIDVRWRNRVAWQRFNMVRQGLLSAESPRGIWEITEAG